MKGHLVAPTARLLRIEGLALAAFVLWSVCAALAHWVGLWLAVGGAAVLLGAVTLYAETELVMPLLRPTLRLSVIGAAAGMAMVAATYALYPFVRALIPSVVTQTASLYACFGQTRGWYRALLLLTVIAGEDLVWRGLVQSALTKRYGRVPGLLLAVAAYVLAVVPAGSLLLIPVAVLCGLYWSVLGAWTRSLVPVLIAHALWDLLVFIVWPLTGS